MSQINRLPDLGKLNCDEAIEFRFNGKTYSGYRGDTLASALLANGVQLVARSFKFHRPRGIMTAGAEEPNALVDIGNGAAREVNQKATQVELYDGLQGQSVNCWPSVEYDISALFGLFSRFLPAGFYYKTFKWPVSWWKLYEYFIRKSAGFGRASKLADPDYYDQVNTHCDVLVVGAGPAGSGRGAECSRKRSTRYCC